jgi:hypothetical protein
MLPLNMPAIRCASHAAEVAYLDEQRSLIGQIERALNGVADWPSSTDYAHTAELGRVAAQARRELLDALGVERRSYAKMMVRDRMKLIQRLSATERKWQPRPEDWLNKYDQINTLLVPSTGIEPVSES